MTLNGAIMQLVELRENSMMPVFFKPYLDKVIETISECEEPSAQPEQYWIPCSERLPKYGKNVLITNDKGNVSYGRFRGVEFWKEDGDSYWTWKKNTIEHVLAWMPLPEPYAERREG